MLNVNMLYHKSFTFFLIKAVPFCEQEMERLHTDARTFYTIIQL